MQQAVGAEVAGTVVAGEVELVVEIDSRFADFAQQRLVNVVHARAVHRFERGIQSGRERQRIRSTEDVRSAFVSHELQVATERQFVLLDQCVVFLQSGRCPGDRDVQQVVDDVIGGRRRGVGRRHVVADSGVGRGRDRVHLPVDVDQDLLGEPRVRLLSGDDPHQAIFVTGEDFAPEIEVTANLLAGDLEEIQPRVLRQRHLLLNPAIDGELRVPQLVRPFDVDRQVGIESVTNVRGEVANEVVVRLMRHVEPRVRVDLVRQLDQVLQGDSVGVEILQQIAV